MAAVVRIPKSISIMGLSFQIEKAPGSESSGECIGPDHLIRINTMDTDDPKMAQLILLHEIIHAILYVAGTSETLDGYDESGKLEEAICTAVTNGLTPLVKLRCLPNVR